MRRAAPPRTRYEPLRRQTFAATQIGLRGTRLPCLARGGAQLREIGGHPRGLRVEKSGGGQISAPLFFRRPERAPAPALPRSPQLSQMAKAAPSKKTAKAAKSASTGAKKARKSKRTETFNSYIHKVLKQVHPGASPRPAPPRPLRAPSTRAQRSARSALTPFAPAAATNLLPFAQRRASPRRACP